MLAQERTYDVVFVQFIVLVNDKIIVASKPERSLRPLRVIPYVLNAEAAFYPVVFGAISPVPIKIKAPADAGHGPEPCPETPPLYRVAAYKRRPGAYAKLTPKV